MAGWQLDGRLRGLFQALAVRRILIWWC